MRGTQKKSFPVIFIFGQKGSAFMLILLMMCAVAPAVVSGGEVEGEIAVDAIVPGASIVESTATDAAASTTSASLTENGEPLSDDTPASEPAVTDAALNVTPSSLTSDGGFGAHEMSALLRNLHADDPAATPSSVSIREADILADPIPASEVSPIALPDYSAEWPIFRGDVSNNAVTSAKTPRTAAETALKWTVNLDPEESWLYGLTSIIANKRIYVTTMDELLLIDKGTGRIINRATLAIPLDFNSYLAYSAYGGGLIYVTLADGRIQAFNAETLASVWITKKPEAGYRAQCPILYHDGYIYTGIDNGEEGVYMGIDVADENPVEADEVKEPAWTYPPEDSAPYFWTGGAVAGDAILFAGDDGVLVSHDLKEGNVIDTFRLGGAVQSSVLYSGGNAYISRKDGLLWCVPIDGDGTIDGENARSLQLSGKESTSAPVAFGGRLYAVSGYNGDFIPGNSYGKLDVIDMASFTRISVIDTGDYSQSSPLLASNKARDGNTVYLYLLLNTFSGDVIVIEDNPSLATPKRAKLYTPIGHYSASSPIADEDGVIYFIDGSGRLTALVYKEPVIDNTDKGPKDDVIGEGSPTIVYPTDNTPVATVVTSPSRTTRVSRGMATTLLNAPTVGELPITSADAGADNDLNAAKTENRASPIGNAPAGTSVDKEGNETSPMPIVLTVVGVAVVASVAAGATVIRRRRLKP